MDGQERRETVQAFTFRDHIMFTSQMHIEYDNQDLALELYVIRGLLVGAGIFVLFWVF